MLPGWCCIANRHIGARERRQLIPHVRFQVPFLEPESQLKSGFACAGLLCRCTKLRYHVKLCTLNCVLLWSWWRIQFCLAMPQLLAPSTVLWTSSPWVTWKRSGVTWFPGRVWRALEGPPATPRKTQLAQGQPGHPSLCSGHSGFQGSAQWVRIRLGSVFEGFVIAFATRVLCFLVWCLRWFSGCGCWVPWKPNKTCRDQSYPKAFPQIHKRESNFPCSLAQITPDNKQRFNTHSVSLARAWANDCR